MKLDLKIMLRAACVCFLITCTAPVTQAEDHQDIPIIQKWGGDYQVAHLDRLPEGQQKSRVGCIGDAATLTGVWQSFRPGGKEPEVDFGRNLVVFSRNVDFYNRISIFKITLRGGVVEIFTTETRSALPIEEKVAMALALIPRAGVESIQAGNQQISVPAND